MGGKRDEDSYSNFTLFLLKETLCNSDTITVAQCFLKKQVISTF